MLHCIKYLILRERDIKGVQLHKVTVLPTSVNCVLLLFFPFNNNDE